MFYMFYIASFGVYKCQFILRAPPIASLSTGTLLQSTSAKFLGSPAARSYLSLAYFLPAFGRRVARHEANVHRRLDNGNARAGQEVETRGRVFIMRKIERKG